MSQGNPSSPTRAARKPQRKRSKAKTEIIDAFDLLSGEASIENYRAYCSALAFKDSASTSMKRGGRKSAVA